MKKFYLTLLTLLMSFISINIYAFNIKVVNADGVTIYYKWTNNNTELSVTSGSYSGNVVIPESVKYNDNSFSVTSIDSYAFSGCRGLTSIVIPQSVTSIGNAAFLACDGLTSIRVESGNPNYDSRNDCNAIIETSSNSLISGCKNTIIPNNVSSIGVSAFDGCSGLTSITIPNSVTAIDTYAFRNCSGLTSVTIPNSVNTIGILAFSGCSGLTSVTIPNSVTSIRECAFEYCSGLTTITIPNSVTSIGGGAFSDCSSLFSVTIPNSVTSIGDEAFYNCSELTSVTIPHSVTTIGNEAFRNCYSLTSVTIPNSVTSIGSDAFSGCSGLTSVTIPNSVTSIGSGVFIGCSGLTSVTIPNSVTSIGSGAFVDCSGLTSVTIPNSVTSIGNDAFSGCSGLTSVTIPNTITSIDYRTFYGCCSLTSITIPNSVTSIGWYVFDGCIGMTSVTIGSGVTSIGIRAFQNCPKLTDVYCDAENKPNTFSDAFEGSYIEHATLHVPAGCLDAYKAAEPWKNFKNIVEITGKIINVATPGTLSQLISDDEKFTITELTITGQLNGDDLRLIREMAGNDYLGQPTDGSLKRLDLSGANIVEGGEKYLDTNQITSSTGAYIQDIGENSFHFATQNNVLGSCLFAGCDKLEEIVLPNSITSIGDYVFWYCLNLQSLEIPKDVSSIGWRFINGPNNISKFSVAEGNQNFSSPEDSNVLMQGTKLILGLNRAIIPAGTTIIGSEAFINCTGINDIAVPEGVTTIEGGAFAWSSLSDIDLPSTLTTIENDAFAGCTDLEFFTLPKSVAHYGEGLGALKDCGNLTSISVEKDNPVYDSRDNCNAIIETSTNTLISGCKNTAIPTSVTILGHQPFRGVTLSNYVIPNWITTIGEMAFFNANMTSVTIPSSVTYIGGFAFAYPTSLTTVTVESAIPVTISENTFTDRSTIDLIVPAGSKAAYEAADYWKEFKTIVEKETSKVKLNKTKATIEKGKTLTLKATVTPSTLEDKSFTWTSSDTKIATVSSSGKVKGVKTGTATITCTSNATGAIATCEVIVGSIKIDQSEIVLEKGKTQTLKSTVYPSTLEDKSVTWKSSDTKIATISSSGKVKGVKTGTATISCTSNATGLVATCKVTVGSVKISQTEIVIEKGKTQTLKSTVYPSTLEDKSVTWKSSDTKIATISSSGKVKGVKTGTATISCTSNATGLVATCKVTVGSVKISQTEIVIEKGKTQTLKSTVYPSTLEDKSVTWKSSDKSVATVSSSGKVKGIKGGTATITCTSNATGLSASCTVTVLAVMESRSYEGGIDVMDKTSEGVEPFDVYDLSGRMVLHQVTSLDGLPKGIYIVNGKKIMK